METYMMVLIAIIVLAGFYFLFNSQIVIGQGFEGFGHMDDDYNVPPKPDEKQDE
jgi:hypothetical protein